MDQVLERARLRFCRGQRSTQVGKFGQELRGSYFANDARASLAMIAIPSTSCWMPISLNAFDAHDRSHGLCPFLTASRWRLFPRRLHSLEDCLSIDPEDDGHSVEVVRLAPG